MSAGRPVLLIAALALALLAVAVQIGGLGIARKAPSDAELRSTVETTFAAELPAGAGRERKIQELVADLRAKQSGDNPPGIAIPALALTGGILVLTFGLIVSSLLVPKSVQGRTQGAVTLVIAAVLALAAIGVLTAAISRLILMLSLLASPPFGTIAYFAVFGFFNRGGAILLLGFLLLVQIAAAAALVLAQPRFLENRGLVLLVLTAPALDVIVGFLLNFVPIPFVSITDAIGAIAVTIVALVWLIFLGGGAVLSLSRLLKVPKPA